MSDEDSPPSLLWEAIERRRREARIRLPAEGVANFRTRKKIRSGTIVEDEVYERIDDRLEWVAGDAKRAALKGIQPRPREGMPETAPVRRLRRLEVAAMFSRTSAMLADADDDVDPAVLDEAERRLRELDEKLKGRTSQGTSGSTGGQRST